MSQLMSQNDPRQTTEYWENLYALNEKNQKNLHYQPPIRHSMHSKEAFERMDPQLCLTKGKTFVVNTTCQFPCQHQVIHVKLKWWAKNCHTETQLMTGQQIAQLYIKQKIKVPDHFTCEVDSHASETSCLCIGY
jgi:hypothetical protein